MVAGALLAVSVASFGTRLAIPDGYLTTPAEAFSTTSVALTSDEIDVGDTGAFPADPMPDLGELARVRIRATSTDPSTHLFLGIGPKAEVDRYLAGVAHDRFESATLEPFQARFTTVEGSRAAPRPAEQTFWVAQAVGRAGDPGPVTLEWDKTYGPWSFVLMQTEGTAGLTARVDIGLRFGQIIPIGVTTGVLGVAAVVGLLLGRPRPSGGRREVS